MFGLSEATELIQGSTERTWNCVLHFVHLLWSKLNHLSQPIMPKSRKRHHSRSRSRSRSHSRDREDKHKKNNSHDKDRDGKRRKVDSSDSPPNKRSVSATPESQKIERNSPEGDSNQTATTPVSCHSHSATKLPKNDEKDMEVNIDQENENEDSQVTSNDVVEVHDKSENTARNSIDEELFEPSTKGSTLDKTREKLEITPKKALSPKQIKKKMESEKKRLEKLKEREEKERKRSEERKEREKKKNEEKERLEKEKQKKKEEKQREIEQKQKEKEMKDEQKKKEREEKEMKRKEKEEKEEQKRKEREQEKLKRQQEIDEKNKEKLKVEEKKQKAAAAFVNFFVPKKTDQPEDERLDVYQTSAFMAFEVKSDMKLPPQRRTPLSEQQKQTLDESIQNQNESSNYLSELKAGKPVGKTSKTWPYEEPEEDVEIIEEEGNLGETIYEDEKLQKFRAKFLKFHENRRPAYFGTWRKTSKLVKPTKPFVADTEYFNYEEDSDDDWEEEEQGESLNGSDEEADKENEDEKDDYEVDNDFFVPHGHLSDDEIDDEETARLSPESLKQKLKLLKDEFDHDMQSKTHKLKPRSIGCIWYNKDGSNVEEAIHRYLQPLAMLTIGEIEIRDRAAIINPGSRKTKPGKELSPEYIPMFLKLVHGKQHSKNVLVDEFKTYMVNNGFTVDVAKNSLIKTLKEHVSWKKCKMNGPLKNKRCWIVNEDAIQKYNIDETLDDASESTKN